MKWIRLVKAKESNISDLLNKIMNKTVDIDIEEQIDDENFVLRVYNDDVDDGTKDDFVDVEIEYDLGGYQPDYKGSYSPFASTPEEYYGENEHYEDFDITKIIIKSINSTPVNKNIGIDNNFRKWLERKIKEDYIYK